MREAHYNWLGRKTLVRIITEGEDFEKRVVVKVMPPSEKEDLLI